MTKKGEITEIERIERMHKKLIDMRKQYADIVYMDREHAELVQSVAAWKLYKSGEIGMKHENRTSNDFPYKFRRKLNG